MNWERARKPAQKAERRESILVAARALFGEHDYEDISLNGIARKAGFSKPNVYRYFATREEIFLVIFEREQGLFVEALVKRLKRIRAKDPVESIARAWVDVALKHKFWLDLLPQLSMSLEKHSSVERIVEFKKVGYERFGRLIAAFHEAHPSLDVGEWVLVAQCGYSLMAGLWPHANPGDKVVEAMNHPDVNQPLWDFSVIMQAGLCRLIRGRKQKKASGDRS